MGASSRRGDGQLSEPIKQKIRAETVLSGCHLQLKKPRRYQAELVIFCFSVSVNLEGAGSCCSREDEQA